MKTSALCLHVICNIIYIFQLQALRFSHPNNGSYLWIVFNNFLVPKPRFVSLKEHLSSFGFLRLKILIVSIKAITFQFSSLSHVRLFVTPWTAAHQASLPITNSRSLLKLMFIKLVCHPTNNFYLCRILLLKLNLSS